MSLHQEVRHDITNNGMYVMTSKGDKVKCKSIPMMIFVYANIIPNHHHIEFYYNQSIFCEVYQKVLKVCHDVKRMS